MESEKLCLGILAGGASSRMGRDKALLAVGEGTFLEHLIRLGDSFSEVLVSVGTRDRYPDLSVRKVLDEQEGFGPVEGICQILCHTSCRYVFLVAADMPGLTADFLRDFAAAFRDEDACQVLTVEGKMEPLCAIYPVSALPVLRQMREEGIRRPRELFRRVRTGFLPLETLGYPAETIRNINTPEDYRAFCERRR